MKDKIFFDTNIILYAYDASELRKRKIASELLIEIFGGSTRGVVSNQVLGEVFSAAVRRLGVKADNARIIVMSIISSRRWEKVDYTHMTIKRALERHEKGGTRFWDAVIGETMLENGITTIVTENEKDFKGFEGIKVQNPFR